MTFGNWPEELHEDLEQKKRIISAKSAKTTPSSIDKAAQTGVFPGSGSNPYFASLDSCTCVDFSRRKKPCKHMYRLAIELGLLDEAAEKGVNKNLQITKDAAIKEIELLCEDSQRTMMKFLNLSLAGISEFYVFADSTSPDLLKCKLLILDESPNAFLRAFKRNQIIKTLDQHGISGFKRNLSVEKMIEWCVNNVPDLGAIFPAAYVFSFSDDFQKAQRVSYSYLKKKYASDYCFDEI